MVRFLIKTSSGEEALIECDAYFDLVVKWCGTYLRLGTYNKKFGKAEDVQYS